MSMQAIPVKEVYKLRGTASISMPEDTPLEEVVATLARQQGIRAVFLVDSQERFAGVITRMTLLRWAQSRLFGGGRETSAWEVLRMADATKAKDLVRPDWRLLGVKESDCLQTALDQMIRHGETAVPVLDSEGRITGDLRVSEVLLKAFEVGRKAKP